MAKLELRWGGELGWGLVDLVDNFPPVPSSHVHNQRNLSSTTIYHNEHQLHVTNVNAPINDSIHPNATFLSLTQTALFFHCANDGLSITSHITTIRASTMDQRQTEECAKTRTSTSSKSTHSNPLSDIS